jgi:muramoyltetrapeptide carboxypeptidase
VAVEDDQLSNPVEFARDLTSLLQQPDAEQMTGLLIGRFQRASGFNRNLLEQIVARHDLLKTIPVVANMDFGHTSPLATLPIGGDVQLIATDNNPELRVLSH